MCRDHHLDLHLRENLLAVPVLDVMAGGVVSLLIDTCFALDVEVLNVT